MGAATPGKPVPGKPPKGMDEGGPKVTPAPLPSVTPSKPEYTPQGNTFSTRTGLFGGLLEAIKKTDKFKDKVKEGGKGIGAPDKVKAEKFDKLLGKLKDSAVGGSKPKFSDVTAGGSKPKFSDVTAFSLGTPKPTPPMGEIGYKDDQPLGGSGGPKPPAFDGTMYAGGSSPIPGVGGHEYLNNPKYAEHRKEYYGYKKDYQDPGTPKSPPLKGGAKKPRGGRKRAVLFGESSPSTVYKKPTKGSPKGGMKKAGFMDAETKNKFEEMLAYMKSFQK